MYRRDVRLEQAVNLSGFRVNINVQVARCGWQTGNGLDISRQSVSKK